MATITSLDSATALAGGTTLTVAGGITVSVDDWLLVILAHPNSGSGGSAPSISMVDSDGVNVYTQRDSLVRDPGASGDGTVLEFWTSQITDAVTAGDITITYGDSTATRTAQVYRIRPATNERITFNSVGAGSTGSASSQTGAGAVSVTNGDVIFGAASNEAQGTPTGDSDTTNGSWSTLVHVVADNGSEAQSTGNSSQYKVVTATGNQTWTITFGGSHDFAANYIILNIDKFLAANAGSYTITGTAASPERGRLTTAAAGSYVMTGTDVSLSATGAKIVNAEAGAYDITGTDASTLQAWKPTAGVGQYDLTGTDTPVLQTRFTTADIGSYTYTGTDAALKIGFKVDATTGGSYALTGTDVALQTSTAKSITALGGSYTYTGTDATLYRRLSIVPDAGSYALTGTNATLPRAFRVFYDTEGIYTLTGTDVTLTKTESAPIPIVGTLVGAPFSHSLVVRRPPATLGVTDVSFGIKVDTTTPSLQGQSHTHTLKVRL